MLNKFGLSKMQRNPLTKKLIIPIFKLDKKNLEVHLSNLEVFIDTLISVINFKKFKQGEEVKDNLLLDDINIKEFNPQQKVNLTTVVFMLMYFIQDIPNFEQIALLEKEKFTDIINENEFEKIAEQLIEKSKKQALKFAVLQHEKEDRSTQKQNIVSSKTKTTNPIQPKT